MQKSCLVLYSGGLDSILACRVLMDQGIEVTAVKFITPFFGWDLKGREAEAADEVRQKYGIRLHVEDITREYLKMVVAPEHGYGRYLNPCIDCKILMVKKALELMPIFGASFIATGEVLGQRPMSQRRDTLRIIERDSGAEGLLVRPLSARSLPPTRPQEEGIIDIKQLPAISGRGRKVQMALAERFGITDYPSPAGGCVLADPALSERFRRIFGLWPDFTPDDILLAQKGRHFLLPGGSWLVVGRNQAENRRIAALFIPGDLWARADVPGPLCLLRRWHQADLEPAARIIARYSRCGEPPCTISFKTVVDDSGRHEPLDPPLGSIEVHDPAEGEFLEQYRF
jgi:hypothetical protein